MRFVLVKAYSFSNCFGILKVAYSILDLKDGVVEEYGYKELKDIIDFTGVKIDTGNVSIDEYPDPYWSNGDSTYTSFSIGSDTFFARLQLVTKAFTLEIFKIGVGKVFECKIGADNKYFRQVEGFYDEDEGDKDFGISTSIDVSNINSNKIDFHICEYFNYAESTKHVADKVISVGYKDGKFKGIKDTKFKIQY